MAKLPLLSRDDLDTQGQEIYDKLIGPRDGLSGMYRTLLNHPELARHVGELGTYLRYQSELAGDIRELGILATARALGAAFVWEKHIAPAERAGLPNSVIAQVLEGDIASANMKRLYLYTWQVAEDVVHHRSIAKHTQDCLVEELGIKGFLDLVMACGMYRMVSTVVFSFDVPLPEEGEPPF
ncbi:carboxymuconolactone decarboxylase family protein [Thalassomonas viridans]|uniref:Carboxymuconolactone decarboxylase family protein n=1 Tax=Thalassomonas viridans TaxID=137584 RepID=A0AAE9Z746_9GAMM|nr:carboxymuconolactone decarboxylase family protein [Thalassomonas viridans]WDE07462.1 carboxymuconolactone decarboxylase family protein [Thalassomonas viridans]